MTQIPTKSREEKLADYQAWIARHKDQLGRLGVVLGDIRCPRFSKTFAITPEIMAGAYEAGVLKASELKDGVYYFGKCRNAYVARWDAKREKFTYIREKFGDRFPEDIRPPEFDNGYDLFIAVCEVVPEEQEKIPEDWKGW